MKWDGVERRAKKRRPGSDTTGWTSWHKWKRQCWQLAEARKSQPDEPDSVLALMWYLGVPETREEYIRLAYLGESPTLEYLGP